jgi:uncharacterized protein YjiS (DUF1127 family)
MHAIPLAAPRPLPRRAATEGRGPWLGWMRRMLQREAENLELRAMDLRGLRDVGLSPGEAAELAAKPLWQR